MKTIIIYFLNKNLIKIEFKCLFVSQTKVCQEPQHKSKVRQ